MRCCVKSVRTEAGGAQHDHRRTSLTHGRSASPAARTRALARARPPIKRVDPFAATVRQDMATWQNLARVAKLKLEGERCEKLVCRHCRA